MRTRIAIMSLCLLLISCGEKSADSDNDPLIGTWSLATMKVDGIVVNSDEHHDVPMKLLFNADGTGTSWESDNGQSPGIFPFTWRIDDDQLIFEIQVDDPGVASYSVSEHELILTFSFTRSVWELRYGKLGGT